MSDHAPAPEREGGPATGAESPVAAIPVAGSDRRSSRGWRIWIKPALFLLVLAFVSHRVVGLWRSEGASLARLSLQWSWVAPAMAAYLAGWLPSVWFWRRLMQRLGARPGFVDAARAYYCGHLGKYVPGKAAVLVIRAGLLRERGVAFVPAALAAGIETLAMMGSGCGVALALAPRLLSAERLAAAPAWVRVLTERAWAPPVLVLSAFLIALPVVCPLMSRISKRMMPRDPTGSDECVGVDARLLTAGFAAFVVGWMLHGLSLGCTLRAIGADVATLASWPAWTGAVSLATAVGFAVLLAPGGLGVREAILIEILRQQPGMTAQHAIAAALLLRVQWLASELIAAAGLYFGARPDLPPPPETANG